MGLGVGLSQWGPWPGKAGLCRTGDLPCSGIPEARADGSMGAEMGTEAEMGTWAVGNVGVTLWRRGRAVGVLRTLTIMNHNGHIPL